MAHYKNMELLAIFDTDGTTVDKFQAVQFTFLRHCMDIDYFEYLLPKAPQVASDNIE
jgi:hypothetical protein